MRLIVLLAVIVVLLTVGSNVTESHAQEGCGEAAGVEVLPDGSFGEVKECETPTPSATETPTAEKTASSTVFPPATETPDPTATPAPMETAAGPAPVKVEPDAAIVSPQPNNDPGTQGASEEYINFLDTDGDGCSDMGELSLNEQLGGLVFDPANPYDNADIVGGSFPSDVTFPDGSRRNPDGKVDTLDVQTLAFRWGAVRGSPLYKDSYNLEPLAVTGTADNDIDIKDLQFITGRLGVDCYPGASMPISRFDDECDSVIMDQGEPAGKTEIQSDSTHIECYLIRDPASGDVIDIVRSTLVTDHPELEGSGSGEIGGTIVATRGYTCRSEEKYESLIFRTDLAKVVVHLRWWVVVDQNSPYYAAVLFRETWKENSAAWPWEITDPNNNIEVTYDDIYQAYRLKARTWTGFYAEWQVPIPFWPDVTVSENMDIHVYTTAGLNSNGQARCWNGGFHT